MPRLEIVQLGEAKLDPESNLPTYAATLQLTKDEDDLEQFGAIDSYQALGVTALPYPKDSEGFAEAVVARNAGNTDGVIIGARDERCSEVYGKMVAGDSALHACDPDASAMVLCKGTDRQVIMMTKDTGGNNMVMLLDGLNDRVQITAFGGIIEMSEEKGIILTTPGGGASIQIKDETIMLVGKLVIGDPLTAVVPLMQAAMGVPLKGIFISP